MLNPAQSKFQIITTTSLPHRCVACNREATGRNEFIDFNVSFDFEGALYICVQCGEEIARTLGFVLPTERDDAVLEVERLQKELEEEKFRGHTLADVVHAFNLSVRSPDSNDSHGVPDSKNSEVGKPLSKVK